MLTQEFLALVRDLLGAFQENDNAIKTLLEIAREYPAVAAEHDKLLTVDPGQVGQQVVTVKQKLGVVASQIAKTDVFAFPQQLARIQAAIVDFVSKLGLDPSPPLDRIVLGLQEFRDAFQAFFTNKHQPPDTFRVIVAAKSVVESLTAVQGSFSLAETQLVKHPPANVETMTLVYQESADVVDLLALLTALNSLARAICEAFDIDPSDRPLTLARLETGSTFAEFFGHPAVVVILTVLLSQWEPIKNFLSPGEASSKALDDALKLMKLSDWLERHNVPNEQLPVKIAKIAVDHGPDLRLATRNMVSLHRNDDEVTIVGAMRLLDNKAPPQPRIEHKPDGPTPGDEGLPKLKPPE
jgi:hypothetical protein